MSVRYYALLLFSSSRFWDCSAALNFTVVQPTQTTNSKLSLQLQQQRLRTGPFSRSLGDSGLLVLFHSIFSVRSRWFSRCFCPHRALLLHSGDDGNRGIETVEQWCGSEQAPSPPFSYSPFSSASRHRLDGRSDSACNFLSLFSFLLFFSFFLTNFILFSVFFFNVNLYRGVQRLMDWSDYIIMQKHRLYYIFLKGKHRLY